MTIEQELDKLEAVVGKGTAARVYTAEGAKTIEQQFLSLAFPVDTHNLTPLQIVNLSTTALSLPTAQSYKSRPGLITRHEHMRKENLKSGGNAKFPWMPLPAGVDRETARAKRSVPSPTASTNACSKCGASKTGPECKVCGPAVKTPAAQAAPAKPLFGLARAAAAMKARSEANKNK